MKINILCYLEGINESDMDVKCGLLAEEQVFFEELHVQSGVSWATLASLLLEEAWNFLFPQPLVAIANQYFYMVGLFGYDDLSYAATIKKS